MALKKGSDCLSSSRFRPKVVEASVGRWTVVDCAPPVLSEPRYEVRLFRLPAVSIVFTSLVAGRRVRRISVGRLP
jgi:hypothetical protein